MNIVGIGSIEQALKIDLRLAKKKGQKIMLTPWKEKNGIKFFKNCSLGNLFHLLGYIGYL